MRDDTADERDLNSIHLLSVNRAPCSCTAAETVQHSENTPRGIFNLVAMAQDEMDRLRIQGNPRSCLGTNDVRFRRSSNGDNCARFLTFRTSPKPSIRSPGYREAPLAHRAIGVIRAVHQLRREVALREDAWRHSGTDQPPGRGRCQRRRRLHERVRAVIPRRNARTRRNRRRRAESDANGISRGGASVDSSHATRMWPP